MVAPPVGYFVEMQFKANFRTLIQTQHTIQLKKKLLHDDVSLFFFSFFKQYHHIEILYQKSINKTVYKSKSVQSTGEKYIYRYVKTLWHKVAEWKTVRHRCRLWHR